MNIITDKNLIRSPYQIQAEGSPIDFNRGMKNGRNLIILHFWFFCMSFEKILPMACRRHETGNEHVFSLNIISEKNIRKKYINRDYISGRIFHT